MKCWGPGYYARSCKWRPDGDSPVSLGARVRWTSYSGRLEQVKAGHGQIAGVMGEPGLGKSRLFHGIVGAYCNTAPDFF